MRKVFVLLLLLGGAGAAAYLARDGKTLLATAGVGPRGALKKQSYRFLECLKFKDFACAAAFHTPEDLKANPNLPKLLEDFFLVPPENLDIQGIEIEFVEFDSTDTRAKVKTTTDITILNHKEKRRAEVMLYWKRVSERWYLDLRTTLERAPRPPV